MVVVIRDVAVPSATILAGFASLMSFAGGPTAVVTSTVPWLRFADVAVTAAVPVVVVDRNVTVAIPALADFVVEPSRVPAPETVNVRALVAVKTLLLEAS